MNRKKHETHESPDEIGRLSLMFSDSFRAFCVFRGCEADFAKA